jgi:hypothetical protein
MSLRKIAILVLIGLVSLAIAEGKKSSKAERIRRMQAGRLGKTSGFNDRKNGVMDNGRMTLYFSNSGCIDPYFNQTVQWPAGLRPVKNLVWQYGIMFGAVLPDGSVVTDESYCDPDVPTEDIFNPEPGYDNPDYIFPSLNNPIVTRSDILESYPARFGGRWPSVSQIFDPTDLRNLARQESFWLMRDDNEPENLSRGIKPIGVEVKCWLIQINSSLTRDFVYAYYRLKNVSGQDLQRCRFGLLIDPDMPALVGAEFEDDDDGFIRDLNLGFARDSDNFYASTPGVNIGHLGVKFLRSPKMNNKELGLTSWTTFEYGDMPGAGQFILAEDGPDENLGQYANLNEAQYDYMRPGLFMKPRLNTDVVFVMGSGDFNLAKGDSVDMAVAFIAAEDFQSLINKAIAAQRVFDNDFLGPTPPIAPAVTAAPGNESVTLYWNAEPTESSTDALTKRADFEGYRIYRSDDRGGSWGKSTDNTAKYPNGVLPIAEYDIVNTTGQLAAAVVSHSNQVSLAVINSLGLADGSQPGDAEGVDNSTFFSNDDYQIIFDSDSTFEVLNTTQGVLLKYLDDLSAAVGFAGLDTSFAIQTDNPDDTHGRYRSGDPIYITGQFVRITDGVDASGNASPATAGDVFIVDQRRNNSGNNSGLVHTFVDKNISGQPKQILNGYRYWYTVAAYDREDLVLGVGVNETPPLSNPNFPGDQTVEVIPQAPVAGFVEAEVPADAVFEHASGNSHVKGFPLAVIDSRSVRDRTYTIRFAETDEEKSWSLSYSGASGEVKILDDQPLYDSLADNAQMFDGMRLRVEDLPAGINGDLSRQTALVGNDTLFLGFDVTSYGDYLYNESQAEKDYEIRFVATPVSYLGSDSGTVVTAPFALFEVAGNQSKQIGAVIYDDGDGVWSSDDSFDLINAPYAPPAAFSFTDEDLVYYLTVVVSNPSDGISPGNIYRLVGNRRLHEEDVYRFTTKASRVEAKASDLAAIRVVPNPFVVTSVFDTDPNRHEIHFTRIPENCTIKIFTLAGDLVKTIEYKRADSGGLDFAKWNLKNEFGSEVAYGVYLYHLESAVGSRIGKIAIVR